MRILILSCLLFAYTFLNAQEGGLQKAKKVAGGVETFISAPTELQDKVTKFFKKIIKKDIKEAYEDLLDKSPIKGRTEEVSNLIKQTFLSYDVYGNMKGYEPVNAEVVTESYMRLRYLGLYEKYPIRWVFTFYKSPESGWIITNVKFDDLSEYFFYDE